MDKMRDNSKTALVDALNGALADTLALYIKSKNFHWHVSGPRFRDLHLLFDEQATELLATVDLIGERVRKNGAFTHTSLGSVAKQTAIADQDSATLEPQAMIEELRDDNRKLHDRLRRVKETAEEANDNATSGIVDDWTDQCEQRIWFLTMASK